MRLSSLNSSLTTSKAYKIEHGDVAWVLFSTCLVFVMMPGLGFYYGGITNRKSQLSMLLSSSLSTVVVSFQWFLWGFSLTFSPTGSKFIGNFDYVVLRNVGDAPHPLALTIPANCFMIFQCFFSVMSACMIIGSVAERTTLYAYAIFLFLWSTFVYDFITYWYWSPNGWLRAMGVLDYAGGAPVYISSGFSSLAYVLAVGPRCTINLSKPPRPSNISEVYLGTALLWLGWLGFNSGSETSINSRAVNAIVVTNLAGCFGGVGWILSDMILHRKNKMSLNGFCAGVLAGLVAITPASGFVKPSYSIIFGLSGGIICYLCVYIKKFSILRFDDVCDVFVINGIGGCIGCLLTGIFAENEVATMSGDDGIAGGWLNQNYIQLAYQLLGVVMSALWSFVVTYLILILIDFLPYTKLKLSKKEEEIGMDWIDMGEVAYGHDIIYYDNETLEKVQKESVKENLFPIYKNLKLLFNK